MIIPVKKHYDRSLRELVNDEGAHFSRGLEGTPSYCPESVPYFEGTRGTGGWVYLEWPSREDSEVRERWGDGLDLLRVRVDMEDSPPSEQRS